LFSANFSALSGFSQHALQGSKLEMSLDTEAVRRIASLARIEVTEGELSAMRDELNHILALVEQMQAADTRSVEPMAHAQDVMLRLRDDNITETDQRELFQSLAPETESGLYIVPQVIDG
jgi:aspartyl-tRNA(Asn)/glutamyl-tRNA(Gln) amidotransferase subunit C